MIVRFWQLPGTFRGLAGLTTLKKLMKFWLRVPMGVPSGPFEAHFPKIPGSDFRECFGFLPGGGRSFFLEKSKKILRIRILRCGKDQRAREELYYLLECAEKIFSPPPLVSMQNLAKICLKILFLLYRLKY